MSNGKGLGAPLVLHTNPEAREEARGGSEGAPVQKMIKRRGFSGLNCSTARGSQAGMWLCLG